MQWIRRHLQYEARVDLDDLLRPYVIPLAHLPAHRVRLRARYLAVR